MISECFIARYEQYSINSILNVSIYLRTHSAPALLSTSFVPLSRRLPGWRRLYSYLEIRPDTSDFCIQIRNEFFMIRFDGMSIWGSGFIIISIKVYHSWGGPPSLDNTATFQSYCVWITPNNQISIAARVRGYISGLNFANMWLYFAWAVRDLNLRHICMLQGPESKDGTLICFLIVLVLRWLVFILFLFFYAGQTKHGA